MNAATNPGSRLLLLSFALLSVDASAQRSVQPGVYSHEPENIDIRVTGARSGNICTGADGSMSVCSTATRIDVTGGQFCESSSGDQQPCTRYGFELDYMGAGSGDSIECSATLKDAYRTRSKTYTLDVDSATGSAFYPTWMPYGPVEQRTILTEVHKCAYQGVPLVNIEYLIYYEPGSAPAAANADVPANSGGFMSEIPGACELLTRADMGNLLPDAQLNASNANEHDPDIWSQCIYSDLHNSARKVGFVFTFNLTEMFDLEKLSPMQLGFNARLFGGDIEPAEVWHDLGKISFVYEKPGHTTLLVLTGIPGPPDGAGRPREVMARYYLDDPRTMHDARLEKLRALAEEHLGSWLSQQD